MIANEEFKDGTTFNEIFRKFVKDMKSLGFKTHFWDDAINFRDSDDSDLFSANFDSMGGLTINFPIELQNVYYMSDYKNYNEFLDFIVSEYEKALKL